MEGRLYLSRAFALLLVCLSLCISSCSHKTDTTEPDFGKTEQGIEQQLASLYAPGGVDAELFAMLKQTLLVELGCAGTLRQAARPPELDDDQVDTLMADDNGDGTFTLTWRYANTGDYDLNGEVNVADITPIALYFGATPDSANWDEAQVADGDANGEVNAADITPIALNFSAACATYLVESATSEGGTFTELTSVGWDAATMDLPVRFSTSVPLVYGDWVRVIPVDGSGVAGVTGKAVEAIEWSDSYTFNITEWQPDAVFIDQDGLGALVSHDPDTEVWVFDESALDTAGYAIHEGDIMLVHSEGLRHIDFIEASAGLLTLETSYAALTDAIAEGELAWDYGVDFRPDRIAAIAVDGTRQVSDPVDPIQEFEFESGGYKYKLILLLDSQFCWVSLQVEKGLGATFTGKFTADGFIERFRTTDSATISGGQLQNFDHRYDGMRGDLLLELVVTAGTANTDEFVNLELPWTMLEYTFLAGPVPVTLKLKLQCVMGLSVPVAGSAWVDVGFSYDSNLGLTYNGTDVGVAGGAGQYSFGEGTHQTGAPNPIVANFGIGFPRVELSVLGDTLVPWGQTAFLIEGNFTPVFPALQQAKVAYIGAIGYKLDLFGLFGTEGSYTIWNNDEVIWEAGETGD